MGKLCSKLRGDRSTINVTILSTDAGRAYGRMDGRLRDFIFCPMHYALHWTDKNFYLSTVTK